MAFIAYFVALATMAAAVFGMSILLEPSPVPNSAQKKVVAEQRLKTAQPPSQAVAIKPADETVTEPAAPTAAPSVRRADDEAAPDSVATLPAPDNARSAFAAATPDEASAAQAAPPAKRKPPKVARKTSPAKVLTRNDGSTRTLRYVGMRDGMPTYMVERD